MAQIILPKRWNVKPPSGAATVNRGHPLAQGLVGCWLFNDPGSGLITNLVNPAARINFNGNTPGLWVPRRAGLGYKLTAGSSQFGTVTFDPQAGVSGSPFSLVAFVRNDVDLGTFAELWRADAATSGAIFLLGNDVHSWAFSPHSSSTEYEDSSTPFTVGADQMLVAVSDGSASVKLYTNGKLGQNTSVAGTVTVGNTLWQVGRTSAAGGLQYISATYYLLAAYRRALSQAEAIALTTDPYAFLVPQAPVHRIWNPVTAAAAALDWLPTQAVRGNWPDTMIPSGSQ